MKWKGEQDAFREGREKPEEGGVRLTKRVVDTRRIIADAFRRPVADKDAACILHRVDDGLCVVDLEDEVFRSVVVAPAHGFMNVFDDESDGVLNGAADDILSREGVGLRVQFVFDFGELFVA